MHYYQFNIKSHSYATKHLSNMEDLAYRRLLDLYYDGEEPLLNDVKKLAKKIGMRDFQSEIDEVLSEFFLVEGDTFRHEKADKEIAIYHSKADTARANGKKGGRPKKTQNEPNPNPKKPSPNPEITQSVNLANPEESGLKANYKPVTSNQEPINKDLSSSNDESKKIANCPHDSIAALYMEILPELARVAKLTDKRKRMLGATWRSDKKCQNLEFWGGYFQAIRKSNFLMGRTGEWSADFDFVINQNKMIKIIEGAYE